MQIMLVFEIQIFVHQIQPVDFWFNISYSVPTFFCKDARPWPFAYKHLLNKHFIDEGTLNRDNGL